MGALSADGVRACVLACVSERVRVWRVRARAGGAHIMSACLCVLGQGPMEEIPAPSSAAKLCRRRVRQTGWPVAAP